MINVVYTSWRENASVIVEVFRTNDFSSIHSGRAWVVVAPTYAWRLPRIVKTWMEHTSFTGNKKIYFVLTCGGDIGNAGKYLAKLCRKSGMQYRGCMGVVMPENYIALFSSPTLETAMQIIEQAEPVITQAIRSIQDDAPLPEAAVSLKDKINSGIVNDLFYPVFVHAKYSMPPTAARPAANAPACVLLTISNWKTERTAGAWYAIFVEKKAENLPLWHSLPDMTSSPRPRS